jgi:hypothetical protein
MGLHILAKIRWEFALLNLAPDLAAQWPKLTRSGNPSSYKAVIEANESGRPAVEKLEPFHPGLVVIVAVRGSHLKGRLCTPHVPV